MPYVTDVFTYFTVANGQTQLVFSANDIDWAQITLHLETAGPVAFGMKQDLSPVASGKGRLLPVGADVIVTVPPSGRLYLVSNTINRIGVEIAPYPWLRDILEAERAVLKQTPGVAPPEIKPTPMVGPNLGKLGWQGKLPTDKGKR